MTQLRRNPGSISNYFARLVEGIGHRGSSFTDVDSLEFTQDSQSGRCLVQEFKREEEPLPTGQRITLEWLAGQPRFTVWVVRKRKDGRIGFLDLRTFRDTGERILTTAEYRARFAAWWDGASRGPGPAPLVSPPPPAPPPPTSLQPLPKWPSQALADGTRLCRDCWRRHNGLPA